MVSHFVKEFQRKHKKDISSTPRSLARLRAACERAKRNLSSAFETAIDIDCLFEGIDFSSKITRSLFDKLNLDLFNDCMDLVEKCLEDARMEKSDIHDVVLVGGSTRIPKVQELLEALFEEKKVCKSINPDEAVASGAAFHAAKLTGICIGVNKDVVLVDVAPLSLGIELKGGAMSVVIPRNTPIPTKITRKDYKTSNDNQTRCLFSVYEGEMPVAKDNNFLGEFCLTGVPPGNAKFNVSFEIDCDGILIVTAELVGSDNWNQIIITSHSGRLSKEEIDRMIEEAEEYNAEDEEFKKASMAKNELENYILYAKDILRVCGKRVGAQDRIALKDAVNHTVEWLEWNEQHSEAFEFDNMREEMESICESIVTKMKPQ
ncbi:unnamed protein product [Cuscuta epithymum]|uniref:Heat shock protein 70 n=1 Tax=Cuscuta epithymum TaxID=186058 RepID=A0AAV0END6_9ASTE|nr:unnamed protein product [Cuscuta epithymum]